MSHYEFNGTLGQCLDHIDEYLGLKDLGRKTRMVIDIDNEEDEKEV
jgi:hypothetical protein